MQEKSSRRVREVGEQGLLKILQGFCPAELVGDDAAAIAAPPEKGGLLVVTTDMLVEGVHFSDRTTSGRDAGWRATAANLSDLAAMGASSEAITVGLGVTGDTAVSWLEELYAGISSCLEEYHTVLAGGDICRASVNAIAITALGWVQPEKKIVRQAAQPGDAIVVSGFHGASRAGLEVLLHPECGRELQSSDREALVKAHQRPKPRLDAIPILWQVMESERTVAGMDSSDGLADAVLQIGRASGVGAILDRQQIPIPGSVTQMVGEEKALEWALYGGEDFELVLCLPLNAAEQLVERLGNGAAIVGRITKRTSVCLVDSTGANPDEVLTLERGFQHF